MSQFPVTSIMRRFINAISMVSMISLSCTGLLLGTPQEPVVDTARFVTFDVPAGGTEPGQGTTPTYINNQGEVLGWVLDENKLFHAFLRSKDGEITIVDVPSAGTQAFQGTFAPGIVPDGFNNRGDVAGQYLDEDNVSHSFAREKDGTITTFDPAGSIAGSYAGGVNNQGEIVGATFSANFLNHAYLRKKDGTFVLFDAPDAGTEGAAGNYQGTLATAINNGGDISGIYTDANNQQHGFLRDKNGNLTEFEAPGSSGRLLAYAFSINDNGEISGFYSDVVGATHGLLRKRDGTLISFDPQGAGNGPGQGTVAFVINNSGAITGFFYDANGVAHGFVRKADGSIITFDAPGAGTDPGAGTFPGGINDQGDVTGDTFDNNFVSHGFILLRHIP